MRVGAKWSCNAWPLSSVSVEPSSSTDTAVSVTRLTSTARRHRRAFGAPDASACASMGDRRMWRRHSLSIAGCEIRLELILSECACDSMLHVPISTFAGALRRADGVGTTQAGYGNRSCRLSPRPQRYHSVCIRNTSRLEAMITQLQHTQPLGCCSLKAVGLSTILNRETSTRLLEFSTLAISMSITHIQLQTERFMLQSLDVDC